MIEHRRVKNECWEKVEVRRIVERTAGDVALACITDEERDAVKALRGALLARLDALDAPRPEEDRNCWQIVAPEPERLSTEAEALRVMGDSQPLVKMREIKP